MNAKATLNTLISTRTKLAASCALSLCLGTASLAQVSIDNNRGTGVEGYFEANVTAAGDLSTANLRGRNLANDALVTTNVIFDYISYVDTGSGAFQLAGTASSAATLSGPDTVVSSGSFTGSGGNQINWTVTSNIADDQTLYNNKIDFEAASGSLGNLTFYQYLDEDVFNVSDDVLFSRGSVAQQDLELFTLDGATGIGVSQSGAYNSAQGLRNASFIGWAADQYDDIQPRLRSGTQNVSINGVIDTNDLPQFNSTLLGSTVRGPEDIVSVMAWEVDSGASSSTVISSLGGITDGGLVPLPEPGNFEFTVAPGEVVTQSLDVLGENNRPMAVILLRGGDLDGPFNPAIAPRYSTLTRTWTWDTTGTPEGEYEMNFSLRNSGGQSNTGSIIVQIVPEPSSAIALGSLMLLGLRRRRG